MKSKLPRSARIASFLLLSLLTGCAQNSGTLSKKDRAESLLDVAGAAIAENDLVSAFETLKQVEALDNGLPREHYLYALAYLRKKEADLAEASARKALELDPEYSAAKNTLGKILLDSGRLTEAEPWLKAAAGDRLFRESYLAMTNLGILYFQKMDLKKSEVWLQKAIEEKGATTCLARFHLGKVQMQQNDLGQALRSLHASIQEGCGGLPEPHLAIGQTLIRQKKYDQARAKLVEIQRLFPEGTAFDQAARMIRGIP